MLLGKQVPTFSLQTTKGTLNFQDLRGQWVVLYFYPKDATPGCTTEGCQFRDNEPHFKNLNALIIGVSRDSLSSHEKFKSKQQFPFDLISDADEKLCAYFDVIKEKNLYGKKVMGIERSTFIIDPKGVIQHEWRKVNVKGHVEEVLDQLKKLQKSPT